MPESVEVTYNLYGLGVINLNQITLLSEDKLNTIISYLLSEQNPKELIDDKYLTLDLTQLYSTLLELNISRKGLATFDNSDGISVKEFEHIKLLLKLLLTSPNRVKPPEILKINFVPNPKERDNIKYYASRFTRLQLTNLIKYIQQIAQIKILIYIEDIFFSEAYANFLNNVVLASNTVTPINILSEISAEALNFIKSSTSLCTNCEITFLDSGKVDRSIGYLNNIDFSNYLKENVFSVNTNLTANLEKFIAGYMNSMETVTIFKEMRTVLSCNRRDSTYYTIDRKNNNIYIMPLSFTNLQNRHHAESLPPYLGYLYSFTQIRYRDFIINVAC